MRVVPPSLVQIEIGPSRVTFKAGDLTFATEPLVHLSSRGRVLDSLLGVRVRGVGKARLPKAEYSVAVFERSETLPSGFTREQCLALFFRYGLAYLINQYTFRVRPNVEVIGFQSLYASLGADTRDLLERTLRKAGANKVALLDRPS